jgi:hypothetical protein
MTGSMKTKRDSGFDESHRTKGIKVEVVNTAIEDMKHQFQKKFQPVEEFRSFTITKCQQIHATNMVKIPRNIKSMKLEEFDAVHQCDILGLMEQILAKYSSTTESLRKSRQPQVSETPSMAIRSNNRSLYTQTVRKGRQ